MIEISDKRNCTGCGACCNICPRESISMIYDYEGFLYPVVSKEYCIECGLCEMSCPQLKPLSGEKRPIQIKAAYNENEDVRINSSSGGIFTLLAEYVLDVGGVVIGASFVNDWNVEHIVIHSKTELKRLRGSKYVQSHTRNIYNLAKSYLFENREVLFSGTPCQISGLKAFLKKEYSNLITVEIICHGVPSTTVFKRYIQEVAKGEIISHINMREKLEGWKKYHITINNYTSTWTNDLFLRSFLSNLILRPSCYNCKHKKGRCGSDIALGDFWGVKSCHQELDDDKGLSLVFLNSEKGVGYLKSCRL